MLIYITHLNLHHSARRRSRKLVCDNTHVSAVGRRRSCMRAFIRRGRRPRQDGRVRSDWYRKSDGVGELGLERQVGSSLCFPPGNGLASSLMYLRPRVSNAVLGLRTGLLSLRRGFVDAAICRRCCGFSAITTPLLLCRSRSRSNQLVARSPVKFVICTSSEVSLIHRAVLLLASS